MIKSIIAGLALGLLSATGLTLAAEPDDITTGDEPRPRGHTGWCGLVEREAGCETRGTILTGFRCTCPWDDVYIPLPPPG